MFGANKGMTASEMGKKGAAATNKILTFDTRSKASKKGWKTRKERMKGVDPFKDKKHANTDR